MSKPTTPRGPFPKKAGPKRAPSMVSYRDPRNGKRHWKTA